jgi:hypothetical protein
MMGDYRKSLGETSPGLLGPPISLAKRSTSNYAQTLLCEVERVKLSRWTL